jgi:hypothetical protein
LRDSLGTLVRSTGNLTTSQNLLNVAQDVSAATGKDLQSVSLALAKASLGQFTALGKLGIPLDESTKKSKDFGKVLETLEGQFGGAADAAANTFGGKLKIIQGQFGEIVETIGAALLPYLDKFATFLVNEVAPAVQRVTSVIGEKGLAGGFQQLIFESGDAGAAVVSVLRNVAIAGAEAANILYKLAYFAKAAIEPNYLEKVKSIAKGFTGQAVDVDKLKEAFEKIAVPVDHYKVSIRDVINGQTNLNGVIEETNNEEKGLGKTSKTLKTATEKLKIYTDALKSSNSAQKSFTSAQKASVKAGESLTQANQGVADAQSALDQAVAGFGADSPQARKAAKELELAQRGLERAGYNVEGSLFAIKDAEEALKKVRADPESTPQAIREAEIALAEAKLSSADAIDAQTEATDGLTKATGLLNEAIFGASIGSDIYTQLSDVLTEAKQKQADATEAVAEAIDRETEALKNYKDAIEAAGKIALLYPKVVAANPMAGAASTIPATVTGNSTGFRPNPAGGGMVVNVNAGLISSPDEVAEQISDLMSRRARLNGGDLTAFF